MWLLLKGLALRFIVGRTVGGAFSLLLLLLVPLGGVLKFIGLPLLLILGYIVVALYAAIIVIAAVAGMAAPLLIRQHQKADQSEIMNNVRQIGLMLAEQEISDGKYPADLNDLKSEGGSKPVATLLQMPRSSSGDWLYYPNADSSAPSALLLISPEIGAKEVVLRVDGSVKLEKAEEAERLANGSSSPPQRLPAPRK